MVFYHQPKAKITFQTEKSIKSPELWKCSFWFIDPSCWDPWRNSSL